MSEWILDTTSIYRECLNSEWMKEIIRDLSHLVPFPFTVKNGEKTIYSSDGIYSLIEKEIKIMNDFFIS